ncbi:MAG: Holliday junction resolvase RuvX [Pleurocapsa sp. SU_196_0]|nr:Holliday junction resolvase RuvX [Pleurocapsa sp. SU_196_0]
MNPPLPAVALDVGDARIGFAVTDGRFTFGRGYHTRASLEADVTAVKTLMEKEHALICIVGLPLKRDGTESVQTQKTRGFAQMLEAAGVTVALQDERFSTKLATQSLMVNASKKQRQEKGRTDEASAVAILETWLQRQ